MQRFSALWAAWEKPRRGSASTTGSVPAAATPAATPTTTTTTATATPDSRPSSAVARRHVREDYWPTSLDKETEKAARILHSFCTEGYINHTDELTGTPRSSMSAVQIRKKIPPRIVQHAVGLAIFSCMRSGLWKSGSGGSGILIARKSDGSWSPPSGLLLHTAALGFVIGVDVYDCVLVINSMEQLEKFYQPSMILGAEVGLAVGPVMAAGHTEQEPTSPMYSSHEMCTYVKARGEHRAVNIDGSIVTERGTENHRFYGRDVSIHDILAGHIPHQELADLDMLYEVIKAAEGRVDFNAPMLEKLALQPAPGDAIIENPRATLMPISPGIPFFGVPDVEDPDPFGVKALEMAGLEIREAGTRLRPASSHFEFNPSPTSPLFGQFNHRQSSDTFITQSNRASYMSNRSNKTSLSRMTDAYTQTSVDTRGTTPTSDDGRDAGFVDRLPVVLEPVDVDYTKVDDSAIKRWSQEDQADIEPRSVDAATEDADKALVGVSVDERDEDADDEDDESDEEASMVSMDDEDEIDEDDEEEPVVYEVYEAKAIQPARTTIMPSQVTQITHAKGALVHIPKRIAPPVPIRSPARSSRDDFSEIPARSPLRDSYQSNRSMQSASGADFANMDQVVSSAKPEDTAHASPASPVEYETQTVVEEGSRSSEEGHHDVANLDRVIESCLSMDDMPKTPSTLQTSGHTSSGDEREPRTPKQVEEDATVTEGAIAEKLASEEARRSLVVDSN